MVNFFSKNDIRLKSGSRHGVLIPNIGFFIGDFYDSIFSIFTKSAFLKDFVRICTLNILGTTEVLDR